MVCKWCRLSRGWRVVEGGVRCTDLLVSGGQVVEWG